jgi:phage terminase small subunit
MRRNGGLFCLGDVVPSGYFTEAEIADLVSRGKITVTESKQVEIGSSEPQAPELVEPQAPELVEPQAPELVEHEDLDEPDEPIDLGAVRDRPKGKPKRGRKP